MRYLGLTKDDRAHMRRVVGIETVDTLFENVPSQALLSKELDFPEHSQRESSEIEVERIFEGLSQENTAANWPCFAGAGAYNHHIPASVDHLIQRSEFLTPYTPYQPEISQGTTQCAFEFQTFVCLLTGMEVANASVYDGACATYEAALMAQRITKRRKVLISGNVHAHYVEAVKTVCGEQGAVVDVSKPNPHRFDELEDALDQETSCVIVQLPDFFGHIKDLTKLSEKAHACGALLIVVVCEVISFGALVSPGDMGADIVAGEGQSLGNPLGFGGPYVGFLATRDRFVRQMPGRLAGIAMDAHQRRGFILTLSAREQHIRREKATSNLCTASSLCALAFTIHLAFLGEEGFATLAQLNHNNALHLAQAIEGLDGFKVLNTNFFNEFVVALPCDAQLFVSQMAKRGILAGVPVQRLYPCLDNRLLLVATTECVTPSDQERFIKAAQEIVGAASGVGGF